MLEQAARIANRVVYGVKTVSAQAAHRTLSVVAKIADIAFKATLFTGMCSSAVLIGDAYAYSNGKSPYTNPFGEKAPLITWAASINRLSPGEIKAAVALQYFVSMGFLVLTPLVALAFHKIKQLTIKYNESF